MLQHVAGNRNFRIPQSVKPIAFVNWSPLHFLDVGEMRLVSQDIPFDYEGYDRIETELATASPISVVETEDAPSGARSRVRRPAASVSATARSTASASMASPKEWRSIIAAERIVARGFAIPLPAMSGALP